MEKLTLESRQSKLELNLELGAQIERLDLKHPVIEKQISVILPFNKDQNFFSSGNFLMYPWVNRLESNDIKISKKEFSIKALEYDSNNQPIHGLYFNSPRKLIEMKEGFAKLEPLDFNLDFPYFTESFYLEANSLKIKTEFTNRSSDLQSFAYGYHPYLKLGKPIENYFIKTNLTDYIYLTEKLLPNPNLERKPISGLIDLTKPIGGLELDHLFIGSQKESVFGIVDSSENLVLQIRTSSNATLPLNYFQIYTPKNREAIAIEPMTSPGNAFSLPKDKLCQIKPGETLFGEFYIELKADTNFKA